MNPIFFGKFFLSNTCLEYNPFNIYSIDMKQRCDGSVDCSDKSDENVIECQRILTDQAYLKDHPPSQIHSKNGKM